MTITNHSIIRAVLFTACTVTVLGVKTCRYSRAADEAQRSVMNTYAHAVEELAGSCDNISCTLEKQLCSASGDMQRKLAVELYSEAGNAKAALSQLPVAQLDLENTYKFLSQVGNYSLALSQKLQKGEDLTEEEYKSLGELYQFSCKLSDRMWELEGSVAGGELSLTELTDVSGKSLPYVTEGLTDLEGTFDSTPKLIYDGPFSDNILERDPEMTKGAAEVSRDKALSKAAAALSMNPSVLSVTQETAGKMPAWRFCDKNSMLACEVTKQGGYISYFLNMRSVDRQVLSADEAVSKAEDFLEELGMISLETTYYEIQQNIMTVNFAYNDLGVTMSPDLVKVSVAMDNGAVTGYDARGYLVNHRQRGGTDNLISKARAQTEVSPKLRVGDSKLAVIPTDGGNEVLCYEFSCRAENGRKVLVYINAKTAQEEQILLLEESESGTLTR